VAFQFNKEKVIKTISVIVVPGGFILLFVFILLWLNKRYSKKKDLKAEETPEIKANIEVPEPVEENKTT
jgi:hypothetical protein